MVVAQVDWYRLRLLLQLGKSPTEDRAVVSWGHLGRNLKICLTSRISPEGKL